MLRSSEAQDPASVPTSALASTSAAEVQQRPSLDASPNEHDNHQPRQLGRPPSRESR